MGETAYSFLYGALKAVSPILIIIVMAIFSYNVLLKTQKMETKDGYQHRYNERYDTTFIAWHF